MTEENYNYRTSQTLLRNQFPGKGKWKIPVIPKSALTKQIWKIRIILTGWCIFSCMITALSGYEKIPRLTLKSCPDTGLCFLPISACIWKWHL